MQYSESVVHREVVIHFRAVVLLLLAIPAASNGVGIAEDCEDSASRHTCTRHIVGGAGPLLSPTPPPVKSTTSVLSVARRSKGGRGGSIAVGESRCRITSASSSDSSPSRAPSSAVRPAASLLDSVAP